MRRWLDRCPGWYWIQHIFTIRNRRLHCSTASYRLNTGSQGTGARAVPQAGPQLALRFGIAAAGAVYDVVDRDVHYSGAVPRGVASSSLAGVDVERGLRAVGRAVIGLGLGQSDPDPRSIDSSHVIPVVDEMFRTVRRPASQSRAHRQPAQSGPRPPNRTQERKGTTP